MAAKTYSKLALSETAEGTLIPVKVVPGASRDRLAGPLAGRLKVTVSRPPEKGAANKAVVALLARALGLKRRELVLTAGQGRPEKTLLARGLSADEVRRRLEAG